MMKNILQKLDNTQTKDRIAKILRQEIISGRLKNDEELTQEQIAQYLNTSRIPVREAFLILELDGFLSRLPNRHVVVVGPKIDLLKDIFELIASVEIQVIKLIIDSKKDVTKLINKDAQQFRQILLKEIEHYFIRENYSRLLRGYPQYVWDNIETKSSNEDLHNNLIVSIQKYESKKVATFIYKYYFSLADSLTKKLNRS